MVPWVMTDQILLGGEGTAKHVLPRGAPAAGLTAELNTQAGGAESAELVF